MVCMGGRQLIGGTDLRRGHFSAVTYVKMKELGPVVGGGGDPPPDQQMYPISFNGKSNRRINSLVRRIMEQVRLHISINYGRL